MSDDLVREYRAKARALLTDLESLADSLQTDRAGERSREFYTPVAVELRIRALELKRAIERGVPQSELREKAADVKQLLHYISASMTRGEIPVSDPDLVARAQDLSLVFQEQRYVGLRTA